MAEQIIDIRERIEKMRIKFEDDHKGNIYDVSNNEKKVLHEEKNKITFFDCKSLNWGEIDLYKDYTKLKKKYASK